MKKFVFFPLVFLLLAATALADDQLRDVQAELKSLGFYYGEANGQTNAETTAALRRYQIRNGLDVTGSLNQETLAAIGLVAKGSAAKAPGPVAKAPPPVAAPPEKKEPPVDLRRGETVEESDRNFLRREETRARTPDAVAPFAPAAPTPPEDSSIVDAPAPLDAPSADFPVLFAGTPYANASPGRQRDALRKAQSVLSSRGFYRDVIDGLPGPATEEALLSYQRAQRLTLTGRLDLETLGHLRLLPSASNFSEAAELRSPQRVYRGIWINRGGVRFGIEFD